LPFTPRLSAFIFGQRAKRRLLVHVSAAAGKALEKKSLRLHFFRKKLPSHEQQEGSSKITAGYQITPP
jgi:hypothetical protein